MTRRLIPKNKNWGSSKKVVDDPETGIRTEFITNAHEPGHIYTKRTQPSADLILKRNQRMRIERPERDLSFGRHVAQIPHNDFIALCKKNPDLKAKDAKIRQLAWARVLKDPANEKYLVVDKY